MKSSLRELVSSVAAATMRREIERETWERAVAIQGLLSLDEPDAVARAENWIDEAVQTQDSFGQLGYNDTQVLSHGHVAQEIVTPTSLSGALGYHVVGRWEQTNEDVYIDAAIRQAEAIRCAPRTRDGGIALRTQSVELWIDTLFMVCPFFARMSAATGDDSWLEDCMLQFRVHAERLLDPHDNLARHVWCETPNTYPQSAFWSRGNGWLTVSIVDSFAAAPSHSGFDEPVKILASILDVLLPLQDASGLWRNVLDDSTSRLEVSGSLMFAYSIARGTELGIVSSEMLTAATRAFRAACEAVSENGSVGGVTVPPGGPSVPFATTSYGQGFFLLAHSALTRVDALPKEGLRR